jgi:hypothetical protein
MAVPWPDGGAAVGLVARAREVKNVGGIRDVREALTARRRDCGRNDMLVEFRSPIDRGENQLSRRRVEVGRRRQIVR